MKDTAGSTSCELRVNSAWTAMDPHDRRTARFIDDHLHGQRRSATTSRWGRPAVSARLKYAVTDVGVADHSSIAGDHPHRPAPDEARCLISTIGGVHHLMLLNVAWSRGVMASGRVSGVGALGSAPGSRCGCHSHILRSEMCELHVPTASAQAATGIAMPVQSLRRQDPMNPGRSPDAESQCCAQLSGSASGAKVGETGAVSCKYSPTSRGDLHGTPKDLGSRR